MDRKKSSAIFPTLLACPDPSLSVADPDRVLSAVKVKVPFDNEDSACTSYQSVSGFPREFAFWTRSIIPVVRLIGNAGLAYIPFFFLLQSTTDQSVAKFKNILTFPQSLPTSPISLLSGGKSAESNHRTITYAF
jgi:hypothetical protein